MVRNDKVVEFDRIVAYGCSFVAGSELIDHLPLSYIGDEDAVDAAKRNFNSANDDFFKKYFEDAAKQGKIAPEWINSQGDFDYHKLFSQQANYTFVNRLAEKFGVPCLNKGWGGASVNSIPYNIEYDLATGALTDTDLIVIGITSPNRTFYLDDKGKGKHLLYGWMNNQWPSQEMHDTFVLHFSNDYNISWEYFKHIKYIDMLNTQLGERIIALPIFEKFSELFREDAYYVPKSWYKHGNPAEFNKMYKQISSFNSILDCSFCEIINPYDKTFLHGHGHPKIKHHEEYAELLHSNLKKNLI